MRELLVSYEPLSMSFKVQGGALKMNITKLQIATERNKG